MSYFDDNEDYIIYGRRQHAARLAPRCRLCRAQCYWQEVYGPTGESNHQLYDEETHKPHVCDVSDDFDDLTKKD